MTMIRDPACRSTETYECARGTGQNVDSGKGNCLDLKMNRTGIEKVP